MAKESLRDKKYYWLKLPYDYFEDDTMQYLEEQENGKEHALIYLKLLVRSAESDGRLFRLVGDNLIPYDELFISKITNSTVDTVKVAMDRFVKLGLVQLMESGEIYMTQIDEMVGSETGHAKQKRLLRARETMSPSCLSNVSEMSHRDRVRDRVRDRDKESCRNQDEEVEENSEKEKKTSCKYSDEHLRLATKLRDNLLDDFPNEMGKAKLEEWANVFRLMEERDSATIEQIEYVVDWLPKNDFWSKNIRSAKKLRKQFEVLKKEIKSEKERPKNGYNNKPTKKEKLPDWAKDNPVEQPEVRPMSEERKRQLEEMVKMIEDG